jgi:hypothetical protein
VEEEYRWDQNRAVEGREWREEMFVDEGAYDREEWRREQANQGERWQWDQEFVEEHFAGHKGIDGIAQGTVETAGEIAVRMRTEVGHQGECCASTLVNFSVCRRKFEVIDGHGGLEHPYLYLNCDGTYLRDCGRFCWYEFKFESLKAQGFSME